MVNYGIAYGLSAYGLADRLNIEQDEAGAYIDRYFERFPAVKRYIEETIEFAREEGYVETLLGRRRPIPELRSGRPQVRGQGERIAVNMPIQGTSADIIKIAMVGCHARPRRVRPRDPPGPPDPRRAALRGTGGRDGRRLGAGRAGDVRGLRARPTARGRHRRRQGLAGREVAAGVGPGVRGRSRRRARPRARPPTAALPGQATGRRRPAHEARGARRRAFGHGGRSPLALRIELRPRIGERPRAGGRLVERHADPPDVGGRR